ncbi:MAG: patatin-like phospholipase family protein [Bacteroidota bacterium]
MNKTIGIALSGGGMRGVAHIGVLQALEDHGINPSIVTGASAGSLVGSLYAAGFKPGRILEIFRDTSITGLFTLTIPKFGLTDLSYIEKKIKELIPEDSFESLEKPFYVSVTNMSSGQFEIINEGTLSKAVVASSSIPILFEAQEINGNLYVDGGLLNNLPVEPMQGRVDVLIGVNVTPIRATKSLDNILNIGYRTLDLIMWNNVQPRLSLCDIAIEPGAQDYGFFQLQKAQEIYDAGYQATLDVIPQLEKLLGKLTANPVVHEEVLPKEEKKESWIKRFFKKIREFFQKLFK